MSSKGMQWVEMLRLFAADVDENFFWQGVGRQADHGDFPLCRTPGGGSDSIAAASPF
jgi:hypothetical protein